MKVIKVTGADFSALSKGVVAYADIMKQKGWITSENKLAETERKTSDGKFAYYNAIKVTSGQSVSVKANNNSTMMLFVKSLMPAPLEDDTVFDLATDSTRILIQANETETQTTPSDAKFVLIGMCSISSMLPYGQLENRIPDNVTIDGIDVTNKLIKAYDE